MVNLEEENTAKSKQNTFNIKGKEPLWLLWIDESETLVATERSSQRQQMYLHLYCIVYTNQTRCYRYDDIFLLVICTQKKLSSTRWVKKKFSTFFFCYVPKYIMHLGNMIFRFFSYISAKGGRPPNLVLQFNIK